MGMCLSLRPSATADGLFSSYSLGSTGSLSKVSLPVAAANKLHGIYVQENATVHFSSLASGKKRFAMPSGIGTT
jgi:hypothetical protein